MLKLNLTFQQGPVLSPLRESPWQSNEETSKSLDGHSFDGVIIYFFLITFSLAEHWRLSWLCQISDTLRIFLTVRWQRCLTPTQQVNLLKRKNPTFPKRLAFVNWMYKYYPSLLSFLDFSWILQLRMQRVGCATHDLSLDGELKMRNYSDISSVTYFYAPLEAKNQWSEL